MGALGRTRMLEVTVLSAPTIMVVIAGAFLVHGVAHAMALGSLVAQSQSSPSERRVGGSTGEQALVAQVSRQGGPSTGLPITRDRTLAYAASLAVAVLIAVVSAAGLVFGATGLYGGDPKLAAGVTPSTAGVLVPGFLAHDGFNLVVGLPVLLLTVWLARRGSLRGLLLWPGALFYVLYTYALYLLGAPFSALFLPYVALVVLSTYATIGLVASVDGEQVRQRLAGVVPARTVGGILVGLAVLTLAQDAGGAIATALAAGPPIDPLARHVWTVDLSVEVPVVLAGGVLLWRRQHPSG